MSIRRLLQLCLIALLLLAQQTALTHATWHAAEVGRTHGEHRHSESGGEQRDDGGPASLCVYHAALGQLLGADHALPSFLLSDHNGCHLCLRAHAERVSTDAVPAVSRGPPLLL